MTTLRGASASTAGAAPSGWGVWARRHPLPAFFVLAFALTWVIMVPLTLASWEVLAFPGGVSGLVLLIIMGYGPTWAALLVTWLYNNTRGSLLLAYLFHGSMNAWSTVLP